MQYVDIECQPSYRKNQILVIILDNDESCGKFPCRLTLYFVIWKG